MQKAPKNGVYVEYLLFGYGLKVDASILSVLGETSAFHGMESFPPSDIRRSVLWHKSSVSFPISFHRFDFMTCPCDS